MKISNLAWTENVAFPGQGENIDCPDWVTIKDKLQNLLNSSGVVKLEAEDEWDRSKCLDVNIEKNMYFLTLGEETEDNWIVKTYKNPDVEPPGEMVEILGNRWNNQSICFDAKLVLMIFEEFFNTGSVSNKYLR
ncbi:DUF6911 family protein [Undibacterium sp. Ji50W]|uniref:DUF6911 family protein n=1 Tax=Undibacterium sp. Ji50W TaxID=3413041 RepID=UPI003BF1B6C0